MHQPSGEPAAEQRADRPEHEHHAAVVEPHVARAHAVSADQEGREPQRRADREQRDQPERADQRSEQHLALHHVVETFAQRALLGEFLRHLAARRLADEQHRRRHQYAGRSNAQEHRLPRGEFPQEREDEPAPVVEVREQPAADQQRQAAADRVTDRVATDRQRPSSSVEVIADQRIGGRAERRLPHAHTDAGNEQTDEAAGEAAGRGHQRPEQHAPENQRRPPLRPVDEAADGQRRDRVEDREGEALQQAHLEIGQAQIPLDRADHQGQDARVDRAETVTDEQDRDDQPRIEAAQAGCGGVASLRRGG